MTDKKFHPEEAEGLEGSSSKPKSLKPLVRVKKDTGGEYHGKYEAESSEYHGRYEAESSEYRGRYEAGPSEYHGKHEAEPSEYHGKYEAETPGYHGRYEAPPKPDSKRNVYTKKIPEYGGLRRMRVFSTRVMSY